MHCTEIFNLIFAENLASSFLEKCYYLEEMVCITLDLVLPERWHYLRDGITGEKWFYLRDGIT